MTIKIGFPSDSSGKATLAQAEVGADVYNNTTQTIESGGSGEALVFNTQIRQSGGVHSTSVNPSRFTAPIAGIYMLSGSVLWDSNATGFRRIWIAKNGGVAVTDRRYGQSRILPSGSGGVMQTSTAQIKLNATEYLEVWVEQNSGGDRTSGSATISVANSATFDLIVAL